MSYIALSPRTALGRILALDVLDPRERDDAGRAPFLAFKGDWVSTDVAIALIEAGIDKVICWNRPATDHAVPFNPYSEPMTVTLTLSDAILSVQSLEQGVGGGTGEERAALQRVFAALHELAFPSLPVPWLR